MDKIDVLKLLESKELLQDADLEELEHLLDKDPFNPVLRRIIYEKKKSLGISLSELEWAEMGVIQPDFDHFFIDVDLSNIKKQETGSGRSDDSRVETEGETNLLKEAVVENVEKEEPGEDATEADEGPVLSADEVSEQAVEKIQTEVEVTGSEGYDREEGSREEEKYESGSSVRLSLSMKHEEESDIEDWTDGEEQEEVFIIEMEEEDEIEADGDVYYTDDDIAEPEEVNLSADNPLTPFVTWIRSLNPNPGQQRQLSGINSSETDKEESKRRKKKESKKKNKKKKDRSSPEKIDNKVQKKKDIKRPHKVKVDKRLAAVIDFANRSLSDPSEVISETLAEILVEQGYFSKAIDMYLRLSLAFPEKSAYFAEIIKKIQKDN